MSTKSIYREWKMSSSFLCVFALSLICSQKTTAQYKYHIYTIAGNGTAGYTGDGGAATSAEINIPWGIALDTMGNVYIADYGNNVIRKVNSAGIISTFAGNGTAGYSGDNGPATSAKLNTILNIATDLSGNLYMVTGLVIRKVHSGIITTIAGNDTEGYEGDGGPADSAELDPIGIVLDDSGNLYIADWGNDVVRRVNATNGEIHSIAGRGPSIYTIGYSGYASPADSVEFNLPLAIAVDHFDNLYISDADSYVIWKVIAATGMAKIVAGTYDVLGNSGDGGPATSAKFNYCQGICIDNLGNLYISDADNQVIRKVEASNGIIYTIAGNGSGGYSGDGGSADSAEILYPNAITVDRAGNIYIADQYNNRIRMLIPDNSISFSKGASQSISVCENSPGLPIDTLLTVTDTGTGGFNTWSLSSAPLHGTAHAAYGILSNPGMITPAGLSYTPDWGYTGADSFTVKAYTTDDTVYTTIHVTVKPSTISSITGGDNLCFTTTETLSDASTGGIWKTDNTHATIDSSGLLTGTTAGSDMITYTAITSCGLVATTKLIIIDTIPEAGIITGAANVCAGAYTFLTDDDTGGIWRVSNSHAEVFSGYTFGEVHGLTEGIDTITYIVTNTCGTAVAMQVVTIDSLPVVGDITGTAEVCTGASITLTDTSAGGTWSATTSGATVISGTVSGISAGVDIIQYTVTSACGSSVASKIITVEPYAPPVSGDTSICPAKSTLLADGATGGIWSAANANALVSAGGLVTGVTTGTDTISYTITDVCGTATASRIINIVTGTNAGIITGDSTVCLGKAIALSDTVSGGIWRAYNDSVVIAHGIVAGILPGLDTITYSVTSFCGTAEAVFVVTILSEEVCDSIEGVPALSKNQIKVYPNPATGVLTIELPQSNSNATIQLMDIIGNVVMTKDVPNQTTMATMDMAGLQPGNYLLRVCTGDTIYRQKVTLAN